MASLQDTGVISSDKETLATVKNAEVNQDKLAGLQSGESSGSEDNIVLGTNPFLDPNVAAHWTKVYDEAHYECRHVFDPSFTWTEEEEKRIIRKLDWRVCLWAVRNLKSERTEFASNWVIVRYVLLTAGR